jgi:hypothetical protein
MGNKDMNEHPYSPHHITICRNISMVRCKLTPKGLVCLSLSSQLLTYEDKCLTLNLKLIASNTISIPHVARNKMNKNE